MQGFLRRLRTGIVVLTTIVVGGGFATAADGSDPASVYHEVKYEIMSFRAIALLCPLDPDSGLPDCTVEFGNVRQGHEATVEGPVLRYATTWANDVIYVDIDSDTAKDVFLEIYTEAPEGPSSLEPAMTADGGPECGTDETPGDPGTDAASPVILDTTSQALITGITDCGIDMTSFWVTAQTHFTVDATLANTSGVNYSGMQSKTVTYTIDAI